MYQPTRGVVYDMSFSRRSTSIANLLAQSSSISRRSLHHFMMTRSLARLTLRQKAARMARFDLLRAVPGLASRVTKWSVDCDEALHRLVCYVNSHYKMQSFIGDNVKSCKLWLFADSDHAGEHDNKSTSGGFLALVGPYTYYPLAALSKKQTSIAVSSTQAEVVCANVEIRLPSSALWSVLQNAGEIHPLQLRSYATCRAIITPNTGYLVAPKW